MRSYTVINKLPNKLGKSCVKLTMLAALIALAGCDRDTSDLDQFIKTTKSKHHGKVDPLPEFTPYQKFTYTAQDFRDPFRSHTDSSQLALADNPYDGPRPEATRRKEPLESYPIDALKMVGLLQQRAQTWGLVRDPDGTIHRVQPGNYAGQNHGKITTVSESRIDIVELVPDGLSGWTNREAQLAMIDE